MVAPLAKRLNRTITIQVRASAQSASGAPSTAWNDFKTLPAEKRDVSAREFLAAGAAQSEVTAKFIIRYRDDITAGMRVAMGSQLFNIEAALDPAGSRIELTLLCSTGLAGKVA